MFADPLRAARAAGELLQGVDGGHAGEPALRVGMARGSLLTQHTDVASLDCFGATAAAASLAVYLAPPRCLQLSGALGTDEAVVELLQSLGFELSHEGSRSVARLTPTAPERREDHRAP